MLINIVAFVLVLGILIFVHELGHFLIAKKFRVGVEKFSLGFGPTVVGKRIGETEYVISAIPLGGYVKMLGEDPQEELSPEDQVRAFNHQALFKRFLIVAAGPVFNMLFAVLIFMGMFMTGYPSDDTTVGQVEVGSPAWVAGIRAGDKIESVNEKSVRLWEDLVGMIRKSKGKPLAFTIRREDESLRMTVRPSARERKNLFGEYEKQSVIGIRHLTLAPVVGISDPASPAGRSGFKTGDQVRSVNGKTVGSYPELERAVSGNLGGTLQFKVEREDQHLSITLELTPPERELLLHDPDRTMQILGLLPSELFVKEVTPSSPAERAGIRAGDRIVEADGHRIRSFAGLQDLISSKPGVPTPLSVIREGKRLSLTVTPEPTVGKDDLGNKITTGKIGILSAYQPRPGPTLLVRYNPFKALYKGLAMTWEITGLIFVSLVKLIQHVIPATTIGGPILIAQLAGRQIQYGFLELFKFIALISINLGILNLLPIPILDGGHLLFFAIEGIMGRPLSMRKREIAQQVGLFLLISLMIFAFYNDLIRVFE